MTGGPGKKVCHSAAAESAEVHSRVNIEFVCVAAETHKGCVNGYLAKTGRKYAAVGKLYDSN